MLCVAAVTDRILLALYSPFLGRKIEIPQRAHAIYSLAPTLLLLEIAEFMPNFRQVKRGREPGGG